jgi:hypothetical protein
MTWERSDDYAEWPGCRYCVHWRAGVCAAYPDRIPLVILSGEIDHLVPRPGQVGTTTFEPIDLDVWQQTGERKPDRRPTRSSVRRAAGRTSR